MKRGKESKGVRSSIVTVVVMLLFAALIIGGYYKISNERREKGKIQEDTTAIQKIMDKDLKNDYPATPREVVKLYSRIITMFYNFDLTQEQFDALVSQVRILFDDELIDNNPIDNYVSNLQEEIAGYKHENKVISEYVIQQGSSIEYYEKDGESYATVLGVYTLRDNSGHAKSNEQFIMRKNSDGAWKILGWQLVDDVDFDEH